ncbi:MAG: adenine phosphoribosyltransferase [Dehalococcoidia bacterium]|nr:adenine phosphoribosyltransferase [Dehalococcoidia bacterium]|tara:strand:+ start:3491 stop:4003 length:513 start_codon:yes stop_codon:yes gene_type:complete
MDLKNHIRNIPDFPSPGILFRDITPLLRMPDVFKYVIDSLIEHYSPDEFDCIVGIESRGFLLGAPIAYLMQKPLVLVRKQGKLPYDSLSVEYSLEYGSNTMEIQIGDISEGSRVLVFDDLLATGGTLQAAAELVESCGATVGGIGLVIELNGLGGRDLLDKYDLYSLVQY